VFVPDKPVQPSLLFAGKTGAYPSEEPLRCSTLGYVPDLTQTLDKAGKACQGQTLAYYKNPCITDKKNFITLAPGRDHRSTFGFPCSQIVGLDGSFCRPGPFPRGGLSLLS